MICTLCNEAVLLPIWYGTPTKHEVELAYLDKIVLGGPMEKEYTHFCQLCQETYPTPER